MSFSQEKIIYYFFVKPGTTLKISRDSSDSLHRSSYICDRKAVAFSFLENEHVFLFFGFVFFFPFGTRDHIIFLFIFV